MRCDERDAGARTSEVVGGGGRGVAGWSAAGAAGEATTGFQRGGGMEGNEACLGDRLRTRWPPKRWPPTARSGRGSHENRLKGGRTGGHWRRQEHCLHVEMLASRAAPKRPCVAG